MPYQQSRNWYYDIMVAILKLPAEFATGTISLLADLRDTDMTRLRTSTADAFNRSTGTSVGTFFKRHDLGPLLFDFNEELLEIGLSSTLRQSEEFKRPFVILLMNSLGELSASKKLREDMSKLFETLRMSNTWFELSGIAPKGSSEPDEFQYIWDLNFDSHIFRFFFHIDQRRKKIFMRKVNELSAVYFELFSGPSRPHMLHQQRSLDPRRGEGRLDTGRVGVPNVPVGVVGASQGAVSASRGGAQSRIQGLTVDMSDDGLLDLLLKHLGVNSSNGDWTDKPNHQLFQKRMTSEILGACLPTFFRMTPTEATIASNLLHLVDTEKGSLYLKAPAAFEDALYTTIPQFGRSSNFADLIKFVSEGWSLIGSPLCSEIQ